LGGLTDNNNENADLLIIAYHSFSYLVFAVYFYQKIPLNISGIFLSAFYELLEL